MCHFRVTKLRQLCPAMPPPFAPCLSPLRGHAPGSAQPPSRIRAAAPSQLDAAILARRGHVPSPGPLPWPCRPQNSARPCPPRSCTTAHPSLRSRQAESARLPRAPLATAAHLALRPFRQARLDTGWSPAPRVRPAQLCATTLPGRRAKGRPAERRRRGSRVSRVCVPGSASTRQLRGGGMPRETRVSGRGRYSA